MLYKLFRQLLSCIGFSMRGKSFVWYIGYGSNIYVERFHCYITGGQPAGSQRNYDGCRNTSLPKQDKPATIKHELYFAKRSSAWENGGVAFVNVEANNNTTTFARMYLVTKQQLEDIAKQETDSKDYLTINFNEAIANGNTVFKSPSWYGQLLYLGNSNGQPMFTLTNEITLPNATKPGEAYLQAIIAGIKQSHKLTTQEIVNYFIDKRGINGNYTEEELRNLIEQVA